MIGYLAVVGEQPSDSKQAWKSDVKLTSSSFDIIIVKDGRVDVAHKIG